MFLVFKDHVDDIDLDLLRPIVKLLDEKLAVLDDEVSQANWNFELQEDDLYRMQYLAGLGFVAMQTYMVSTFGCLKITRDSAFDYGPKFKGKVRLVRIINCCGNYWKHCDEWDNQTQNRGRDKENIVKQFNQIGVEMTSHYPYSYGYPLLEAFYMITNGQNRLSVLVDFLVEWRNDLIKRERYIDNQEKQKKIPV